MRYPDQSLIGDLSDSFYAKTSGSVNFIVPSEVNENNTTYNLLPIVINKPPVIISSITDASSPPIKPSITADGSSEYMHLSSDGTVKVILGTSFTFRINAEQPSVLNVENGILKMLDANTDLTYIWRRDGVLVDTIDNPTYQSYVIVDKNTITFKLIQPISAGTYTCDISNDVGTTTSEPITLEVLDLDYDSYFFTNLITNPNGLDGVNGWESNNNDLTTKTLTNTTTQALTAPNRVDLFGYNVDCMHPRPYQLDIGIIKNYDLTSTFVKKNASYFTRSRYKFERKGGSFLVKAYQDIDLSDASDIINGRVYGVQGVRAMFSCYIGNALAQYIPVQDIVDPSKRLDSKNYIMSSPRLGLNNFLNAGPALGPLEAVYVTLEEYDNETRLVSKVLENNGSIKLQNDRITLWDPWNSRISNYWGRSYAEGSNNDVRDATLFTADELYPDEKYRFTYGQYVEFNKTIIDKLNPATTKVRVSLNFQTNDERIFEQWKDGSEQSDEVYEVLSWESPYEKGKFAKPASKYETTISQQLKNKPGNADKTWPEVLPAAQDPRGMVTGLNLSLFPVLSQQPEVTEYYTKTAIVQNDTPASAMISGLVVV
jgi:hypothetical protein